MPPHKSKSAPAEGSSVYEALCDLGESDATAAVLAALIEQGPSLIKDIAVYSGWSIPAVSQELAELEEIGWVSREKVPNMKRGRDPYEYRLEITKTEMGRFYRDRVKERLKTIESAF
ncbi:MAG: MarR family transcriptional regulator [Euryarchaeota archaeon]|nr:MarR family transcriptional regulator [Euryarchaeota archaeon]